MLKTTKSAVAVLMMFFLFSVFGERVSIPDTLSIMREGIIMDLQGITRRQAEIITAWTEARKKDVRVTAHNLNVYCNTTIREDGNPDFSKPLEYLNFVNEIYHYKEVFITDTNGMVILSTEKNHIGRDVSSASYFQESLEGKTILSDIIPSEVPLENEWGDLEVGLPTLFVSTPINSEKTQTLGVLVFRLDINSLIKLILPMKATKTGEIYLINSDGLMLTNSRFTDDLKKNGMIDKRTPLELRVINPKTGNLTLAVQQCLKGREGYDDTGYMDYRGVSVIGYWTWMRDCNWGLIAEINVDEACDEIRKFIQDTTIKNLRGLMHRQVNLIRMYMEGHKNNAMVIAKKPQVSRYTKGMASVGEFVSALGFLEFIRNEYKYKGIFLCDSEGVIKLSTEKNLVGVDISRENYFIEGKKQGIFVSDVRLATTPIMSEFGKVERNIPTLFVSSAVSDDDGGFTGVLVIRLDTMELNKLMQSAEIGESGEMYLINSDGVLITESRFIIGLKRDGRIKDRTALELKGIDPQSSRLTKGIAECLNGGEGYDATGYLDYRGIPVLGTWYWIPEYEWGVITEIDLNEAFRKSSSFWGIKQYF